jgi:lambda repressor-like predicted transcriptional regulator
MAANTQCDSRHDKLERLVCQQFAELYLAFLECSNEVQEAIRDMARIVRDPESDPDEREAAIATICEALFPSPHDGDLGVDLGDAEQLDAQDAREVARILAELNSQEATFADRVSALLKEKRMTQAQLADAIGVGQPAVSMMLARQGRPQRKTVEKVAVVLGVDPCDIWPEYSG